MLDLSFNERDRRWREVRKGMKEGGIDCLVIGGTGHRGAIFTYSAYLAKHFWEGYTVFPLEGDPTILTFLVRHGDPSAWIPDQRTGHPNYAKAISDRLKEIHMENAKIGLIELSGYDADLGFPYSVYMGLSRQFPKAKFEDATDIMRKVRMIKSDEEIKCLEYACEVGQMMMQAIIKEAKPGVTDTEVKIAMMNAAYRHGCDPHSMILFNAGKEIIHGGMDPRFGVKLEKGDIINIEFDTAYLGYRAQFNQPFSLGKPDEEWQRIFEVAAEAVNVGIDALKPGITTRELDEVMTPVVRNAGYVQITPNFHGMGLSLEEPFPTFIGQPSYQPNLDLVIQKGMVIELEPPVITPDYRKGTTLGSQVLVTENGCRTLAKNWKPEVIII